MTMSHQKRCNKTHLNSARKARTMGDNQRFDIKTGHIQNLSTRSTWLLGNKGEYAWHLMAFFESI